MPYFNFDDLRQTEPITGFKGRFLHSEHMTIAAWRIDEGSGFPEHSHPHEQVCIVTEGDFELTINGETQVLRSGLVGVIPPNVAHEGRALTDCRLLDLFSPVREDLR